MYFIQFLLFQSNFYMILFSITGQYTRKSTSDKPDGTTNALSQQNFKIIEHIIITF